MFNSVLRSVLLWFEVFLGALRLGSGCCDRSDACVVGLGVWVLVLSSKVVVVLCLRVV